MPGIPSKDQSSKPIFLVTIVFFRVLNYSSKPSLAVVVPNASTSPRSPANPTSPQGASPGGSRRPFVRNYSTRKRSGTIEKVNAMHSRVNYYHRLQHMSPASERSLLLAPPPHVLPAELFGLGKLKLEPGQKQSSFQVCSNCPLHAHHRVRIECVHSSNMFT